MAASQEVSGAGHFALAAAGSSEEHSRGPKANPVSPSMLGLRKENEYSFWTMAVNDKRTRNFSCLIVDDDQAFATMAATVVRNEGGEATTVHDLTSAREKTSSRSFDLVLLDNHLPDGKGYDFFETLARRNPNLPVIMITGLPDLGEAVALTRNGLFEYLIKPISVEDLAAALQRAQRRLSLNHSGEQAADFFGEAPVMREVFEQLRQAARHLTTTVLFTGETGSGKDVAARALHGLSFSHKERPFIAVNCAALPADMFEAELFGAEKGAYTGADKKRAGLAAAAAGGTLFLDEIAEVPLALQSKLLRLLEAREYRPLGGTATEAYTGRFVAATNRDLAQEVKAGRFREDLLYRLDVFAIALPPLRQRRVDIPGLAQLLLKQLATRYERATPLLKPEDVDALSAHSFPGNVRELRNVLERSLLRTADDARWLAMDLNWLNRSSAPASIAAAEPSAARPAEAALPVERELSPIEAQEYQLIRSAIAEAHGGIRRAAAKLGLSPQALLRRLEKWPELRIEKH